MFIRNHFVKNASVITDPIISRAIQKLKRFINIFLRLEIILGEILIKFNPGYPSFNFNNQISENWFPGKL